MSPSPSLLSTFHASTVLALMVGASTRVFCFGESAMLIIRWFFLDRVILAGLPDSSLKMTLFSVLLRRDDCAQGVKLVDAHQHRRARIWTPLEVERAAAT
eukprot:9482651-Pyramimonas_sp.AAC.1